MREKGYFWLSSIFKRIKKSSFFAKSTETNLKKQARLAGEAYKRNKQLINSLNELEKDRLIDILINCFRFV